MVPAVGNAPMQNMPMRNVLGTSAQAAGVDRSEMHGDNPGGDSGSGFGSAMTAALADAKESVARDVAPGVQSKDGTNAKAENAHAAKVTKANTAGSNVGTNTAPSAGVGTVAGAVRGQADVIPAGSGNHHASSAATPEGSAESLAAAKSALPGLQVDHIAAQNQDRTGDGAQIPEAKPPMQVLSDPAGQPDETAGETPKPDSKKAAAKDSVVSPTMIASNAMTLSVAAVAAPAPTASSKIPVADSHSSAKGGGGAATATNKHGAVTAGVIVAKNVAVAMQQAGLAASAEAAGAHTGANATRSVEGKSNTAPVTASGAVRSNTLAGTLTAGVAADPGAGVQPAAHVGLDAQHATAPGVQGGTAPGTMTPGAKNLTATGVAISGGLQGNGLTAALLNGHPGTAQTMVQPQAQAAATGSGAGAANPYARMDETHAPSLVYVSPQRMSVAVSDPSLGNFQVRAQNAGAQVAASLATASASTHAQLSGQLPSLTAFLQEQRVNLPRVTVVQQSLLGGDSGARGFGEEQQGRSGSSGSSGSRGARSQRGRVDAVGTSTGVSAMSSAAELHAEAGVRDETTVVNSVSPRGGIHDASFYVDVHA